MITQALKQNRCFLLFVFLLALTVRSLLFWGFLQEKENCWVYFDSAQYHGVAQQMAQGKGISTSDGKPNFYRLPGYPFFLSMCYKLFGENVHVALWVQIFISCLLPLLIFCLAFTLFPGWTLLARCCALVSALHLGFVLYAGLLATETFFTMFFLLFLILFFRSLSFFNFTVQPLSAWWCLLAGLALGCASLVRPVGHFVLVVSSLMLLFSSGVLVSKLKKIGVLFFGWLVPVLPWLIRNYLLTGMIFFHTLPGLHFLQYVTAKVVMHQKSCSYVAARGALLDEWESKCSYEEKKLGRVLFEPERCKVAEKITLGYMLQEPGVVIKNCLCEMFKTCLGLYSAQMIFTDVQDWSDYKTESHVWAKLKKYLFPRVNTWYLKPLAQFEILFYIFLLLGFLGFIFRSLYSKGLFLVLCKTVPFMGLLVGLTCAYGCARLRFPLEPLLLVTSLSFWCSMLAGNAQGYRVLK